MAAAVAAEETLAFHRAADLYRLAIEHREMEAEELRRAWGRAGHALCHAGRLDAAAKAFATAAKGAEPNERLEYSRLELEQILRRGHLQRGLERAGEVMHQVGSSIPLTKLSAITVILKNRARLRLTGLRYRERPLAALPLAQQRRLDVAWSVSSALAFVSPVSGRAMQMQFMWEALRSGVPRYVIKALCLEIGYLGLAGLKNRDRCEALRTRVLALADEMDEKQLYGTVEGGCGIASFMFGRFRESYERLTAGEKYLRDNAANARWEIDIIQVFQAGTLLYLGRFGELGRILPLYIREAEERGDVYATRGLQAWRGNRLWLALDQPDEALRRIEDVSIGDSGEFHLHHYYELVSRTCVDLYNEHGEAAHRRVSEAWPSIKRSQLLRVQSIRVEGWFLRGRSALARAKGESASERRALIAEALDASKRIERERLTWASTLASLLRAGCDRLAGAEDAAVDHLRRAIVDASEADMGAFEAVAQVRCGVAIGGDEGGRMVASATRRLEEESVGNPTALVNLLAPGC